MIKKYYIKDKVNVSLPKNVACIGYFDGVHLGHQALIKKTIELADKFKVEPYLITFNSNLKKNDNYGNINSLSQRIKLFEHFGIKGVVIIEFNDKLMNLNYKDFINKYLLNFNLEAIVCGEDFSFGKGAIGKSKDLKKYLKTYIVKEVKYYGKKISSYRIKQEISKKNYKLVDKLLGYKYER